MKTAVVLSIVAFAIISTASCKKDLLTPVCETGVTPTYNRHIVPIIQANCVESGCHAAGSENGDFTTYYDLHQTIMTHQFSKRVLQRQNMPANKALTQEEIDLIQCWEDTGYLED